MVENVLTFGQLVRLKREQLNIYQHDLGKKIGYQNLSQIERNKCKPRAHIKQKLIDVLKISPAELAACKDENGEIIKAPDNRVARLVQDIDSLIDDTKELSLTGALGKKITEEVKSDLESARALVAGLDILDRLL